MARTFAITLPSFAWRKIGSFRFLMLLTGVALCLGGIYWWKNVLPFFTLEEAVLCVASLEARSEESGRLLSFPLEEGDFFQPGQRLFSLDQKGSEEQLKELDRKIGGYKQQIEQTKKKINQTMEQYQYLQTELSIEGQTSELLEQIMGEAQKMQGHCFQAERELAFAENERIEIEKALAKRSYAPEFDGIVLRCFKKVGDEVRAAEPIALIANHQKRWVEAEIPEKMLTKIQVGSPGFIEFSSYPKKKWSAQVSWISPVAKGGKLKIRLAADNLPFYSGLTAKASIRTHATAR